MPQETVNVGGPGRMPRQRYILPGPRMDKARGAELSSKFRSTFGLRGHVDMTPVKLTTAPLLAGEVKHRTRPVASRWLESGPLSSRREPHQDYPKATLPAHEPGRATEPKLPGLETAFTKPASTTVLQNKKLEAGASQMPAAETPAGNELRQPEISASMIADRVYRLMQRDLIIERER